MPKAKKAEKDSSSKLEPFWKRKSLSEMSPQEWESLCDGCGKCCLNKLIDEKTEELFFTNVACRLLDLKTCRCTSYTNRRKIVKDCTRLTPKNVGTLRWLPETCAYRLVAEGKDLENWHPLVSGDPASVHSQGKSIRNRAISENDVEDLEDHIVEDL